MPICKAEAIVLNKYDVRETSIIVNFYTREYGKISGVLKGIRKDPRKFSSAVQQFSLNDIIFYPKRNTHVHLVSQCEVKNDFSPIRSDVQKIGSACLAMEIIASVMAQEDANEEVFDLVLKALTELATTAAPDKVMTIFKIKILTLSGFKPHLDSCVLCGARIMEHSKFSLSMGGLLCMKCQHKDTSARGVFRGTIATILHIERNDFKTNLTLGMNPQIKKELELILNSFLRFHLEKELKSQKVLNKLENFIPALQ